MLTIRFGIGMNTDHTFEEVGAAIFGDEGADPADRGQGAAEAEASGPQPEDAVVSRPVIGGARKLAALLTLCFATALVAAPALTRREAARAYAAAIAHPTSSKSCRADIGLARARSLARYCRYVSGATHPPCNVLNSCAMMVEHIRWFCHDEDSGLPCSDYFAGR